MEPMGGIEPQKRGLKSDHSLQRPIAWSMVLESLPTTPQHIYPSDVGLYLPAPWSPIFLLRIRGLFYMLIVPMIQCLPSRKTKTIIAEITILNRYINCQWAIFNNHLGKVQYFTNLK